MDFDRLGAAACSCSRTGVGLLRATDIERDCDKYERTVWVHRLGFLE